MKRKRSRGLGGSDNDHVASAKQAIDGAYQSLESMPPTCEGGMQVAARAVSAVSVARAHLNSIGDRSVREANTNLFGLANIADKAAWETVRFFSQTCKAPHREAGERPLMSRAKAMAILNPPKKRKRR